MRDLYRHLKKRIYKICTTGSIVEKSNALYWQTVDQIRDILTLLNIVLISSYSVFFARVQNQSTIKVLETESECLNGTISHTSL